MRNMYDIYPKVLQVLDLLATGQSETRSCDEVGVNVATFKRYVAQTPELTEAYEDAQQRGFDALADALLEPDVHPLVGTTDPKVMKIVSDNIKWVLRHRDARRFGERVAVDVNITADRAITNALERAKHRAIWGDELPVIDVAAETITAPALIEYAEAVEDDDELLAQLLS